VTFTTKTISTANVTASGVSTPKSLADWTSLVDAAAVTIIKAGVATTADVPDGKARIVKDVTGGSVKLVYNDGGTLKSVTLT
jgi:hypothetical protein